jgi:predicted RNA-binding Zn-ribbon protein involved in translation (DUF1610 family)
MIFMADKKGKQKETKESIDFCPKCGQPVSAAESMTPVGGAYVVGITSNWFSCDRCGYEGPALQLPAAKYKEWLMKNKS